MLFCSPLGRGLWSGLGSRRSFFIWESPRQRQNRLGGFMRITVRCPACQKKLSVPSKKIGRPVSCPWCQASFIATAQGSGISAESTPPPPSFPPPPPPPPVPAAHPAVVDPSSDPAIDSVTCPHCHKLMAGDATLAGQLVQCPHCQNRFHMPTTERSPSNSKRSVKLPKPPDSPSAAAVRFHRFAALHPIRSRRPTR